MTLHLKTLACLSICFLCFILLISFASRKLLIENFTMQEKARHELAVRGLRTAILNELVHLEELVVKNCADSDDDTLVAILEKLPRVDNIAFPADSSLMNDKGVLAKGNRLKLYVTGTSRDGTRFTVFRDFELAAALPEKMKATLRSNRQKVVGSSQKSVLWVDLSQLSPTPLILKIIDRADLAGESAARLTRLLRLILGIGLAMIVVFLLFLQYMVLGRITNLHMRLRQFRLGRLEEPPGEEGTDELALLGGEMNDLLKRNKVLADAVDFSEKSFKAYIADNQELVCRFSPDGILHYASDGFCRYFGKSRDEMLDTPFSQLLTPGSRREVRQYLTAEVPLDTQDFECQAINAEGMITRQHWVWHGIFDDDYQLVEYQGVGRDITQEWNAQNELRQQRELEQLLLSISTNLINLPAKEVDEGINRVLHSIGEFAQVDTAYTYRAADEHLLRSHLWRQEEDQLPRLSTRYDFDQIPWAAEQLRRNRIIRITRPEDLPPRADLEREFLVRSGINSMIAVPMMRSKELIGAIIFETEATDRQWDESIDGFLAIAAEMIANAIERKAFLESLEESQERLRQIIGAVQTGIFVIRLDTREIVDVNEQAEEMVGLSRDAIVGSLCMRVFESLPPMPGTPREGLCWNVEDKLKTKEGGRLPVLRTSVTIRMEGKLHLIESVVDLTNQKKLESQRMQNERLQGVLEMAGATCHELNQPLQVITGYTELLMLRTDEEDPNFSKLKLLREQAAKLAQLTRKINNITTYETQDYLSGKIIDIDKSVAPDSTQPFALPADRINRLLSQVMTRNKEKENEDGNG